MKTSIIILTHNNLNLTKACIKSVEENTEDYELILIDNGSTDGTAEYIQTLPGVKCILNQVNAGFAYGCNQGIVHSTGDYILFLNNDTVVTKNWLVKMLAVIEKDPQIGLVGPVSSNVSGVQRVSAISSMTLASNEGESFFYSHRLVGFCLLVKRAVLEEIGGFDEQFSVGGCEDDDLCYRALEKGYRLAVAKDVYIHHVGHASFTGELDRLNTQNENLKKLYCKWEINYFPYLDARVRLNSFMNILPQNAIKVLDIGCGIGVLGLELLNQNNHVELWGVEDNPLLAKMCSPYYKKILSKEDLPLVEQQFDVIVIQSSVSLEEKLILDAMQCTKKSSQPVGVKSDMADTKVYFYLSDIMYANAMPIIKPVDSLELTPKYLQIIKDLFYTEEYNLGTTLRKTIKPTEESILLLTRLIEDIEKDGMNGEVVSEWVLESSEDYAKYIEIFDRIFQYDLVIEVSTKNTDQAEINNTSEEASVF